MSKEIDFLIDGYKKFRKQYFGKTNSAFKELALNGQNPKVLIIACSDSRVLRGSVCYTSVDTVYGLAYSSIRISILSRDIGFCWRFTTSTS